MNFEDYRYYAYDLEATAALRGADFELEVLAAGQQYDFIFSWNSEASAYSVRIYGPKGHIKKFYAYGNEPFVIPAISDTYEERDAYVAFVSTTSLSDAPPLSPVSISDGTYKMLLVTGRVV